MTLFTTWTQNVYPGRDIPKFALSRSSVIVNVFENISHACLTSLVFSQSWIRGSPVGSIVPTITSELVYKVYLSRAFLLAKRCGHPYKKLHSTGLKSTIAPLLPSLRPLQPCLSVLSNAALVPPLLMTTNTTPLERESRDMDQGRTCC